MSGIVFPHSHSWRDALLLHIENKKPYGLRRTRVATRDVYICGRLVKDFAGLNGLGFTTLHLSNDASLEHIYKDISVMSMGRDDLSWLENNYFDQTFFPRHIGKIFRHQRRLICNLRMCAARRQQ